MSNETQGEYLDRICSKAKPIKRPKKRLVLKPNNDKLIFGYKFTDIQAMQQGTYKPRLVDDK